MFSLLILLALNLIASPILCGKATDVQGGLVPRRSQTTTPHTPPSRLAASNITAGKLRFVENSGICETTPNVYQASGYGDLTETDSIWFWFFAARNNPDIAPLTLWFNGGPGATSMIGLFQEHGPCRITNDSSTVVLNPYSWNNESNIIYIDQPIGTGFSHGNLSRVGTSQQAAADVWSFLQIFLSDPKFAKYQARDMALWTESYGGHYGPAFATYFLDKNAAISNDTIPGIPLNLKILAIGNGITDPLSQYPGYVAYAANNPYHPLVSSSIIASANQSLTEPNGCIDRIKACYANGNNSVCSNAQGNCDSNIQNALPGDFDPQFVLATIPDDYPPKFEGYLGSVAGSIGVDVGFNASELSSSVANAFGHTGDLMRNSRPDLEAVINAGIRVLLYNGDADYMVNFMGVEDMISNLNTTSSSDYNNQTFQDYKVAGEVAGQFKQAGNFTYIRIFGAGHEVAAYKSGNLDYGQAAAQMFKQFTTMGGSVTSSSSSLARRSSLAEWTLLIGLVFIPISMDLL